VQARHAKALRASVSRRPCTNKNKETPGETPDVGARLPQASGATIPYSMSKKVFFLAADAIKPDLARGQGSCLASDLITVQGLPVGFMYREDTDNDLDSGWRFFAGRNQSPIATTLQTSKSTMSTPSPTMIPESFYFLMQSLAPRFERPPESVNFKPVAVRYE
jgi:hypothetical protein